MPRGNITEIGLLPPRRHSRRLADDTLIDVEPVPRVEGHIAGAILSKYGRTRRRRREDSREGDVRYHDTAHRVSGIERCH